MHDRRGCPQLPDEQRYGYYGSQNIKGLNLDPFFVNGSMNYNNCNSILNGDIDSEPDNYIVSITGMGISFSFKLYSKLFVVLPNDL